MVGLSVAGYREPKRLAGLAYGPAAEEQWGQESRSVDFFDVKADIEALFAPKRYGFPKSTIRPCIQDVRHKLIVTENWSAVIGELHPRCSKNTSCPLHRSCSN